MRNVRSDWSGPWRWVPAYGVFALAMAVGGCSSGATAPAGGGGSTPGGAASSGSSSAGTPEPSSPSGEILERGPDGSLSTVPPMPGEESWSTTRVGKSEASRLEDQAGRPAIRLPRGAAWTTLDSAMAQDPFVRDAVAYTGAHGAAYRPFVMVLAENVDIPARSAPRERQQCLEPTAVSGITDLVVLVNKPVDTKHGLGCLVETEYTAKGMRLRERNYSWDVPNRLGNTAVVRVMSTTLAQDWPRLGKQIDTMMNDVTIEP